MKFIVMVKATKQSEAGAMPTEEMISTMGKFNEELHKAGLLVDLAGLHPSSKASKVVFKKGEKPAVIDGPFAEAKELVAGYWVLQAKSRQEVVEWIKRAPMLTGQDAAEIEIRQVMGPEDLGDSPAVKQQTKLGEQLGLK
jgi:hypothetical protein